jgi:hypothetical protein
MAVRDELAETRHRYDEIRARFDERARVVALYRAGEVSADGPEVRRVSMPGREIVALGAEERALWLRLVRLGDPQAVAEWREEQRAPFWWRATTQDWAWRGRLEARRLPSSLFRAIRSRDKRSRPREHHATRRRASRGSPTRPGDADPEPPLTGGRPAHAGVRRGPIRGVPL